MFDRCKNIYIVRSIATAAVLFAPFVVSAVSNQLNINQVVITSTTTEETSEEAPAPVLGGGGIAVSDTAMAVSLKISDLVIAPTSNSANITWNTDKPLRSRVRWGVTKDYELGELALDADIRHTASIGNLSPDAVYYLRVESEEGGIVTSWFTQMFTTLPISILPPQEEVQLPARPVPLVPEEEKKELIIPTILPKEVPEGAAPSLELEERVREPFIREAIDETVSRIRDTSRTYGNAIKGFFLRVATGIAAAFIFVVDRLKGLFFKN